MGEQNLNIRIKHKYDTEANWNKNNPVLLSGEIAITSDKFGKHKVGDGTHKWSELSYVKADLTKSDVISALGYTPPSSDTWRGIQDNLISSSTTESLSAAQGKILKELVDGKAPSSHTHTKSEVGLGNVDNTADATKSVKYAISAGSASSAAALTSNAGSSTQPVYFSGGKPVACSYTLGKSVPADALFTDHTYGNMKGATSSSAGSAGLVPAPNIGEQLKFLRADGAWVIPTNTTYSVGTSSYLGITKLYTETGSATDGTMTQNAITTALNGKSPTSHTHNYAGSSSAGGAATSAIKLSTPRKIGNASFDGSSDITLAQMGVNNPIEITKAEYENLKKNNKIDMSAYYNIIDDYDSIDIINDEYISSNQVFSSSKIDSVYSKKSISYNITLESQKWVKKNDKYQYVLSANEITEANIIEINYSPNATADEINAYQKAYLTDGGQSKGQGILLADTLPAINIPITVIIRNDL